MTAAEIATRFDGKRHGKGWTANCPAHEDRNASLSIAEGDDGRTLLHCFAGCEPGAICAAAGITTRDLFPTKPEGRGRTRGRIVATYDYTDPAGKLLFQVVRFDPKDFSQRRPDPAKPGTWTWSLNGQERVLYRLPDVIRAKAEGRAVFLVEGEKDVAAMESIGCTATCNPGGAVSVNAKTGKLSKWEPAFTETLTGAKVIIIPDRDGPDAKNPANSFKGQRHAALLRQELTGKAESVRVIELPDRDGRTVKDAADWIAAGGTVEELREIVRTAPEWEPPTEEPTARIGEDRRAATSPENGTKGGRPPAPPHAQTADEFARDELTTNGMLTARYWHGQWYAYDAHGWHAVADVEMQGRVVTYLRNRDDLRSHATAHYAASVMLNLRAHDLCGLPESVRRPSWLDTGEPADNWIAFDNGVVVDIMAYAQDLADDREPADYTRPVSPAFFSGDFVSYPWNPDAFPEKFHAYLDRVQPDAEQVLALCRMLGLLVADTARYEVFWQLYGKGCNGKTVLLDVIRGLVAPGNVSFVPLAGLVERFQPWPLADAKVNVCGELPTDIGRGQFHQIEGTFKDCVSGATFEVEKKGQDKYPGRCRARFVLAANSLPTFVDRSDGIWRRLRIIPFAETIHDEEKDVHLAEKIVATELPGVMAWALDGLVDVIRRGNVPDSPAGAAMKQRHRASCDHEREFLAERYEAGTRADRISAVALYAAYSEWMTTHGYRPLGAAKFFARVEDVFTHTEAKYMRIDGPVVRGFEGLRQIETEGGNRVLL